MGAAQSMFPAAKEEFKYKERKKKGSCCICCEEIPGMTLQVKVRYFTCRSRYPIAEGNTRSPWTLPETFVQSNILRAKNYEINKTILYTHSNINVKSFSSNLNAIVTVCSDLRISYLSRV